MCINNNNNNNNNNNSLLGYFSLRHRVQTGFGPTQPPIQRVPGRPFPRIKRPGREAGRSHTSGAEVKNAWRCTSTLPIHQHGVVVNQAQDTSLWRGI